MSNKVLICLVVVLFLGLAIETAYLLKLKNKAKENENIRISSSISRNSFNNRSFYEDIWGDSFFEKPFGFGNVWSHDPLINLKEFKEIVRKFNFTNAIVDLKIIGESGLEFIKFLNNFDKRISFAT